MAIREPPYLHALLAYLGWERDGVPQCAQALILLGKFQDCYTGVYRFHPNPVTLVCLILWILLTKVPLGDYFVNGCCLVNWIVSSEESTLAQKFGMSTVVKSKVGLNQVGGDFSLTTFEKQSLAVATLPTIPFA